MGKAGLILLLVAGMSATHPAGRRRARETGAWVIQGIRERLGAASASLETLPALMRDFRGNDRDSSKVNDFWIADVGLYAPTEERSNEFLKLLEISVAGADLAPLDPGSTPPAPDRGAPAWMLQLMRWFEPPAPRSGWDIID